MISIIIVNYNGYRFLSRLLNSIKNQSYKDYEIIFVDNTSSDDSIVYIKNNYPSVKTYIVENRGYGTACNFGAKNALGKYVMFLNEDMYIPKKFLKDMLYRYQYIKKHKSKNIGGLGCKIIAFDSDPKKVSDFYGGKIDLLGFPNDNKNPRQEAFIINGCPLFIDRKIFLKSKGFNENIFLYGEDADLCWRLTLFGYQQYVNNNMYLFHYGGGVTGAQTPKKVANIFYGTLIPVVTNYGNVMLFIFIPLYTLFILLINIAFLVFTKGNIQYNIEVGKNLITFFKNIQSISKMRKFVQKNRIKSDKEILKHITLIPSVILNLSYKRFLFKKGRV